MKTKHLIITLCFSSIFITNAQAEGDSVAGKEKVSACVSCHGADGKGNIPLLGKSEDYLAQKLRDYKTRKLKNVMMNMIAKKLSDTDISELAAYYSQKSE